MADMKIDEAEFMELLAGSKRFMQGLDNTALSTEQREARKFLLTQIERQSAIRNVMYESKLYYNFYVKNRNGNQVEAAKAYHNYKQCSKSVQTLKKAGSASAFLQALVEHDRMIYGQLQFGTMECLQLLEYTVKDDHVSKADPARQTGEVAQLCEDGLSKENMEALKEHIRKNGFQPTKTLLNNIKELAGMIPGKGKMTLCTLPEIKRLSMSRMTPDEWRKPIDNIVRECREQEMQRQKPVPKVPGPAM